MYNNQLSMASIIDNFLEIPLQTRTLSNNDYHSQNIVNDLSKKINDNNTPFFITHAPPYCESSTKIELQARQYLLQVRVMKSDKNLIVSATEIQGSTFKRMVSRAVQLQVMRELSSQQHQFQNQSVYALQDGHLKMTLKGYFNFSSFSRKKFIDIYNQIIIKNTHNFHQFLVKHFKDAKTTVFEQEKEHELHQDLSALLMMHTETNFDYSESTSQYNLGQAKLKKQKAQLKNIWENIIVEKQLQRNIDSLYCYRLRENSSQWAKDNLMHLSDCHQRKYKNSLQVKRVGEKKIDDFVYNIVKAEVKEKSNKPIAQGGSCYIHRAKVIMSFVSSFDKNNSKTQEEKIQKMVAIKSVKEDSLRLLPKLQHQKNIVVKLRGSITYFLPKYYGTNQQQGLNNGLLMEMINGEPLDVFAKIRSPTISFKTKIYLLLNIIYGIRHLIKYEIVHLDLKPINIMVCKQLITKIIDFGQAHHKQVCPKDYCPGFTFPYVAPEVYARYQSKLQNKVIPALQFSEKQDSFAFGMIIYQLIFSSRLLQHSHFKYREIYSKKEISSRIFLNSENLQAYGQSLILSSLLTLVTRCIDADPQKRPKFDWIGVLFKIMLNSYKSH